MGNVCVWLVRRRKGRKPARRGEKAAAAPAAEGGRRPSRSRQPDPGEYTSSKLSGATLVKPPGSLNGLPFVIEECENSNIYIFERTAQVTVDECSRCNMFIGPSEGSVFLRNCADCVLIVACQQFRLRDCTNIDVHLYTFTQPIIETSTGIRLGCFQFFYSSLRGQFSDARLSVWNNCWSDVFDFNGPNTADVPNDHYSFLPELRGGGGGPGGQKFDFPLPRDVPEGLETIWENSVVPLTLGRRPRASNKMSVVVSFGREEIVHRLLDCVRQSHPRLRLVRTRKSKVNREASLEALGNAVASHGWKSIPKEYDSYVALEFTYATVEEGGEKIADEVSAAVAAAVEGEGRQRKETKAGAGDGYAIYSSANEMQAEADVRNLFGAGS